jgi:hypothetical protein
VVGLSPTAVPPFTLAFYEIAEFIEFCDTGVAVAIGHENVSSGPRTMPRQGSVVVQPEPDRFFEVPIVLRLPEAVIFIP